MSTREPEGESLAEQVGETGNVLLLAPALDAHEDEACAALSSPTLPSSEALVAVTYSETADERLDAWREQLGGADPGAATIVSVGETTRAGSASVANPSAVEPGDGSAGGAGRVLTLETVDNPGDLTGLGIVLSRALEDSGSRKTVVCFRSLSVLLQYADLERTFRFLHVLTNRVKAVDALAHYHMDPTVHDDQDVNTLLQLFDAVVEFEDGDWSVRTR